MRILLVTTMLPYRQAAMAQPLVVYGQLSALRPHHEITVATFAGPDPRERDAIEDLRHSGFEVEAVWRVPLPGARQLARRAWLASAWMRGTRPLRVLWFQDSRMQQLVDRLLFTGKFDLLQVEDNAMAAYFDPAPRLPAVLTEHDVRAGGPEEFEVRTLPLGNLSAVLEGARLRRLLTNAERKRFERHQPAAWRRFDRVQVFTQRDAGVISSMAPDIAARVRINPFGIDPPAEADLGREERNTLVFVGTFLHPANVDAVMWLAERILPLLRARKPGVRLTLVGPDPPEAVRALASQDVTVTGYVPAVEPFLERAAVVLAPMRIGGGMRRKVLEAMALGKAVVTTPVGAQGLEVAGNQPPVRIAQDAHQIAKEVVDLLEADDERHALGRRARRFVIQHYTWSAYAQRLETIYAELQSLEKH
jgi:polysaccharide biosynthesis protein PslH